MATDTVTKVRENRLRQAAQRQGLTLRKSRTRDRRALDYGRYTLTNDFRVADVCESTDLDEIEAYLNGEPVR